MRRLTLVSLILPAMLLAAALPAPAIADAGDEPCKVGHFNSRDRTHAGGANGYAVFRVRVEEAARAPYDYLGITVASRGANDAWWHPTERALAALFVEDLAGTSHGWFPLGSPSYRNEGALADGTGIESLPGAQTGCQQQAILDRTPPPPGEYRLIVIGASESGSEFGIILSPNMTLLGVETGAATPLVDTSFDCAVNERLNMRGVIHQRLEDCAVPLSAEGRAYWVVGMGNRGDADHVVQWRTADGTRPLANYGLDPHVWGEGSHAASGDARVLEVPRYVTAARAPALAFGVGGAEFGVFGAYADIPDSSF